MRKSNIETAGNQPWIIVVFIILSLLIIFPLLYVISVSVSSDADIARYGYKLIPQNFSFQAYDYIFRTPKGLLQSYLITIIVTTAGTTLSLLLTSSIAYVMTRKDYRYSRLTTFFCLLYLIVQCGSRSFLYRCDERSAYSRYALGAYFTVRRQRMVHDADEVHGRVAVRDHRIRENRRSRGMGDICPHYPAADQTGTGDHRPVLCPRILERLVAGYVVHPERKPCPSAVLPAANHDEYRVSDQKHAGRHQR